LGHDRQLGAFGVQELNEALIRSEQIKYGGEYFIESLIEAGTTPQAAAQLVQFYERIRFRRIALGWSQEDMEAEVRQHGCPITRGRLSNYESNRQTPMLKTMMAFAKALGCTVDQLVYGDAPGP